MKILFAAQDPGGANALLPVIKKMRQANKVVVFAAFHAVAVFKAAKLRLIDCTKLSDTKIKEAFRASAPERVVVGTSSTLSLEKKITSYATEEKILSVSAIDYWGNYPLRYSDPGTKNMRYVTDMVCVVDEHMKKDCRTVGIPLKKIVVTGNPYLQNCIKKITVQPKKKGELVFISQPLSLPPYNTFPFNEYSVLTDLANYPRLKEFKKIHLKLHPKEDARKYDEFVQLKKHLTKAKFLVVRAHTDLYRLLSDAEVIIGMNSMVLLEAGLAGKNVISYQPDNTRTGDVAIGNKLGVCLPVYSKKDLYRLLDAILAGKKVQRLSGARYRQLREAYAMMNAVQNIVTVIKQ